MISISANSDERQSLQKCLDQNQTPLSKIQFVRNPGVLKRAESFFAQSVTDAHK